jgi:hypothetical protein
VAHIYPKTQYYLKAYYDSLKAASQQARNAADVDIPAFRAMRDQVRDPGEARAPVGPPVIAPRQPLPNPLLPSMPPGYQPSPVVPPPPAAQGPRRRFCPHCKQPRRGHPKKGCPLLEAGRGGEG